VLRLKEDANDYRYFPDPDLVPLTIDPEQIEAVRAELPELPDAKRARFESEYGLSRQDAEQLTVSRALAVFFEATEATCGNAKAIANWMLRDLLQALKEREWEIDDAAITPGLLASLVELIEEGRLTVRSARELFPELVDTGADPETLMRERGLEAVSDAGELEAIVDSVIEANSQTADKIRGGDDKPLNALMGQVMKQTQGKANPAEVRKLLAARLRGS
jgi:aspartyl-tRNA(Asn)/glutamyl-tRNA(Gln) amidotransferase subunit B